MSKSNTLILLGYLPIKWFLKFQDSINKKISDFDDTDNTFGKQHKININGKIYMVIPLCHPIQAGKLCKSSTKWKLLHDN